MKRFFIVAVASVLTTVMSTTAWSNFGGAGAGSVGASSFTRANPFNDARIRRQLNLSQNQIRELRALNNSWRQQLQRLRRGAGNDLNSVDQTQLNQMWQQYVMTLNGVLSEQQQQAWSQLIGQLSTFSPSTSGGRTGTTATRTNPSLRAGMVSTRQTSPANAPALAQGTKVGGNIGTDNFPTSTQQGVVGGGTSALGPAAVIGQANRAGPTQAQGGGGSSAFGTALVTGEPAQVPGQRAGILGAVPTQAQGGGGSSAFGTALLTGQPARIQGARLRGPGRTQAQGGGGSSFFGTLQLIGGAVP